MVVQGAADVNLMNEGRNTNGKTASAERPVSIAPSVERYSRTIVLREHITTWTPPSITSREVTSFYR